MKKLLPILLACILCVAFCACGGETETAAKNENQLGGSGMGNVGINNENGITYKVPSNYDNGSSLGTDAGIEYVQQDGDWYIEVYTTTNDTMEKNESFKTIEDLLLYDRVMFIMERVKIDGKVTGFKYLPGEEENTEGPFYTIAVDFIYNDVLYKIYMFTPTNSEPVTEEQQKIFDDFIGTIELH